jgi:oxidase EvaA
MQHSELSNLLFLKSAFTSRGSFVQQDEVAKWLADQNSGVKVEVRRCPLRATNGWVFDEAAGRIRHQSGKFFSIDGISIQTNWSGHRAWQQPIINQPEVGYLGIITREFDGVLHFLLQAKIEPGNIHHVQLSPTLQATRSNYTQVHKGREPLYLDYFRNARPDQILLDQLQSEQGARFLRKRNRNIILKIDEDIPVHESFVWLTLGQIKELMQQDNLVNMDTRTVISGITYGDYSPDVINLIDFLTCEQGLNTVAQAFLKSSLTATGSLHSIEEIITFLTQLKSMHDLDVERVPLTTLEDWVVEDLEIRHRDHKYFKVIAVDVEIGNREVVRWSQPMIQPAQEGLCAFVAKEINGLIHFAVQAKLECGNHDIVEFAPTVQCLTGNYRTAAGGSLPFLDYVLNAPPGRIVFDTMQSEEGGRFYREQNRNMVVLAGDDLPQELPPRFIWMSLHQLQTFLKFNNYLNIQSRSLIAALSII